MNADKVAKYRKKVSNRLPTLKRVHTYREKKKKSVKKNSKKIKKIGEYIETFVFDENL